MEQEEEIITILPKTKERDTKGFPFVEEGLMTNKSHNSLSTSSSITQGLSDYTNLQKVGQVIGDMVDAGTPSYVVYTYISPDSLPETLQWLIFPNAFIAAHMIEKALNTLVSNESPMLSLKAKGFGSKGLALQKISFDWTISIAISSGAAYGFLNINSSSSMPTAYLVPLLGTFGLVTYSVVAFSTQQGVKWFQNRRGIFYEKPFKDEEKINPLQFGGKTIIWIALDLAAMMAILKSLADAGHEDVVKDPHFQLFMMITGHLTRQLLSLSYIPDIEEYFAKAIRGKNEENFLTFMTLSQKMGTTPHTLEIILGALKRMGIDLAFCSSFYLGVEAWCWWGQKDCHYDFVNENLPVLGTVLTCGLVAYTAYDYGEDIYKGIKNAVSKCYFSVAETCVSFFWKRQSRSAYEVISDAPEQNVFSSVKPPR